MPWARRAGAWATQNFLDALSSWTRGVEVEVELALRKLSISY
jgi:hypothetical protein